MNANFPDLLINGLLICLYAQLLIVGVFHFFNYTIRNFVFGAMCCLLALSFIYTIYWPSFNNSLIFNILLGGYKHMFMPALVYLYLACLEKESNPRKLLVKHLTPPFMVHVCYLLLKFGFKDFYSENIVRIVGTINFFILSSYLFYLAMGVSMLHKLKSIVIKSIYKRYSIFLYSLMLYGLFLTCSALIPFVSENQDYIKSFSFHSLDIYVLLAIVFNLGVLVFAIMESPKLKNQLYGKKIYSGFDNISNETVIKAFITKVFDQEKLFTDANFNLKNLLQQEKINHNEFKLYINKEYSKTPIEFINGYRVREFKNVVLLEENARYSLLGIANMVGFKSKATFYRNFKSVEGITPKQYCSKILEKEL